MAGTGQELRLQLRHEGQPHVVWSVVGGQGWPEGAGFEDIPEAIHDPQTLGALIERAQGAGLSHKPGAAIEAWARGAAVRAEAQARIAEVASGAWPAPWGQPLPPGDPWAPYLPTLILRPRTLVVGGGSGAGRPALIATGIAAAMRAVGRLLIVASEEDQHRWTAWIAEGLLGPALEALILSPAEVYRQRALVSEGGAPMVIVDGVHRLLGGGRALDVLRGLDPPHLIALSALGPEEIPLRAFDLMRLMAPDLAGPRRSWWVQAYRDPAAAASLEDRFEPLTLRPAGLPRSQVRRVGLGPRERGLYDRGAAALGALLSQESEGVASPEGAPRIAAAVSELLHHCDGAPQGRGFSSAKLTALLDVLTVEVGVRGRKVAVFTLFEDIGAELAERLSAESLPTLRYYRKLPRGRRARLVERFNAAEGGLIFVSAEPQAHPALLRADLMVHVDRPWAPEGLRLREAAVEPGGERLLLLAADTLEAPVGEGAPEGVGEESWDLPTAELFQNSSSSLDWLRGRLAVEATPLSEVPLKSASKVPSSPAAGSVAASPEGGAAPGSKAAPGPGGAQASVDPLATAAPGEEFENAARDAGLGTPGSEGPAYRPAAEPTSGDGVSSPPRGAEGPLREILDGIEAPLKAVNRLLAGVPLVGRPVSELTRILWEQLNVALGRR